MAVHTLSRSTILRQPLDRVFDFFSRAENLERITPPFLRFRIVTPQPVEMRVGALIEYSLRVRGLPLRWVTRIEEWNPPHHFVDVQLRGPYKQWHHTHRFTPVDGGTEMADLVRYELPFGPIGEIVHFLQVKRDVQSIFEYREGRLEGLFTCR